MSKNGSITILCNRIYITTKLKAVLHIMAVAHDAAKQLPIYVELCHALLQLSQRSELLLKLWEATAPNREDEYLRERGLLIASLTDLFC
eukprot:IDg15116t1